MDEVELKERREAKAKLGWDECAATGAGHSFDGRKQPDGKMHCQYCGAELLPEECEDEE